MAPPESAEWLPEKVQLATFSGPTVQDGAPKSGPLALARVSAVRVRVPGVWKNMREVLAPLIVSKRAPGPI